RPHLRGGRAGCPRAAADLRLRLRLQSTSMRAGAVLTLSLAILPGMLWMPRADAFTGRGPSTPRERAKALKLIRQLEEDPDFDGSRDARRWLSLWLFQVPDLKLDLCPELLGGTPAMRRRIPAEVVAQT